MLATYFDFALCNSKSDLLTTGTFQHVESHTLHCSNKNVDKWLLLYKIILSIHIIICSVLQQSYIGEVHLCIFIYQVWVDKSLPRLKK